MINDSADGFQLSFTKRINSNIYNEGSWAQTAACQSTMPSASNKYGVHDQPQVEDHTHTHTNVLHTPHTKYTLTHASHSSRPLLKIMGTVETNVHTSTTSRACCD